MGVSIVYSEHIVNAHKLRKTYRVEDTSYLEDIYSKLSIFSAAGAPEDVQMRCFSNEDLTTTYTLITWKAPKEARGTIQGYNVSKTPHQRPRMGVNEALRHLSEPLTCRIR